MQKYKWVYNTLFGNGKQLVLNKHVYYDGDIKLGNLLVIGKNGIKDSGFKINNFGEVVKDIPIEMGGYFA
jgi:hypothetical protein